MKNIEIHWTYDAYECELCGGDYANGAIVLNKDTGEVIFELEAIAHCYDSQNYQSDEVLIKLLNYLGYTITTVPAVYRNETDAYLYGEQDEEDDDC